MLRLDTETASALCPNEVMLIVFCLYRDLSETQVTSLPSIGMETIEKLQAENTWALKVLPPFQAFLHLQSAELTFPSHCCGLKMLKGWRG